MINILDIIVGGLILYYLLKNAGGLSRTIKNFLVVICFLIVFGIICQLFLQWDFAEPTHEFLENSYLVRLSHMVIKWVYPALENTAPKVDSFMKEKILAPSQLKDVDLKELKVSPEALPKINLPSLPQGK